MGKKRRGGRQQVRQVKPKGMPSPAAAASATPQQQRRQRERYLEAGGMLQGYAPEFVMRLGVYAAAAAVFCLVVMVLLIVFLPYDLPVRIAAAMAWIVPIVFGASFLLPGVRLAMKDRKQEPKLVQGQLMGASEMSTSLGLGMLMVKTRGGVEQFLLAPEKLSRVPGNQVPVVLTITPGLKHVRSVGIMGQKIVGRPDQPVPEVVRRLRLLPLITPLALSLAVIVGDDAVAASPIQPTLVHAILAVLVGALLGAGVYGLSILFQRRMYNQVQALMPGMGG